MRLDPEIIAAIAAWVAVHEKLPVGEPRVEEISRTELARKVPDCAAALERATRFIQGRCTPIAFYDWDKRIVYVAKGAPQLEGESYLAHEFRHVGDHNNGRKDPRGDCEELKRHEADATATQNAFNDWRGIDWHYAVPPLPCDRLRRRSVDDEQRTSQRRMLLDSEREQGEQFVRPQAHGLVTEHP